MKKIIIGALSIGFLFGGVSHSPVQANTLNDNSSLIEVMSISRNVTHDVLYSKGATIPGTYYYNSLGWTGTLTLQYVVPRVQDDYLVAVYSGTVHCLSGNCPAPAALNSAE
ncbi:hypothetical protein [Metasolibacillus sp. FSL K6-0083]|uniref:hypothetical protein n=1 Tax=Metasolibacillus sp. FSL K6-0083 TaxID=2921416 RepID=UPI00315AC539